MNLANFLVSLAVTMLLYVLCDDIQFADALVVGLSLYIGFDIGDTARAIRKLKE